MEGEGLDHQNPLLIPIDGGLRDKIGEYGNTHPILLIRLAGRKPVDVLACETQESLDEFIDVLQQLPEVRNDLFLRGVERALCDETYEAADAWFRWSQEDGPCATRVYLGLPEGLECPAYFGYPGFGQGLPLVHSSASQRKQVLVAVFEAYATTDGNNKTRFRLMEALAFALSRTLGEGGRFVEALSAVERALSHHPWSIHLKAAQHALNARICGLTLAPHLEKFCGTDNGDLHQFICSVPFERMEIGYNGAALLCCGHWLPTVIGNVIESPVFEVLNSPKARKVRESTIDGSYKYCNHLECPLINQRALRRRDEIENPTITKAIADDHYGVDGIDFISFGLDRTCNLSCPSCRTDRIIEHMSEAMAMTQAVEQKLYPLLPKVKMLHINPAGELFASKSSRRVLELISDESCPELALDIISNGTLFNEREWARYPGIHNKVWSVRISTDAATKETFEKLRRLGRYETFVQNLLFLGRLRSAGVIGVLRLNFTYQLDNFREMRAFVDMVRSVQADFAIFQRLQNMGAFSQEEYLQKAVHRPEHPLHREFLRVIDAPVFRDPGRVQHDFDFLGREGPSEEERYVAQAVRQKLEQARSSFLSRRQRDRSAPSTINRRTS
jgi:MoaA/NifB/PqqE/SkfB family radical SAM enzyme